MRSVLVVLFVASWGLWFAALMAAAIKAADEYYGRHDPVFTAPLCEPGDPCEDEWHV